MSLETSKNLGGVGALLIVISGLGVFGTPYAGLLGFVGLILVLIAMKGLADFYKEGGIFNNALYGVIAAIVGAVAFVAAIIVTVFATISAGFDWSSASSWTQQFTDFSSFWNKLGTVITGLVISLVVLFILFIIAFILFRKSLTLLASKSGVGMFGTAGLLMLIGAVLTIIFFGIILIWIGFILLTVAFFSIKTQQAPAPPPPPQPA
jgi:uncharacterized membrane protein